MARPRLHAVDESFFDVIDGEAKAYWLGFLYADGHPAAHALMLGLASIDAHHVERFRSDIGSEHSVRKAERCVSIAVSSRRLSRKVRELRDSVFIPSRFTNHFVRGVFDGDGCIHVRPTGFANVSIAGDKPLIDKLLPLCIAHGAGGAYTVKHHKPGSRTWVLLIGRLRGVCAFRDWIYRDATIFLARKKQRFDPLRPIEAKRCIVCGRFWMPRFRNKGRYCSSKCHLRAYYAANRDRKWKTAGAWH